MTIIATHDYFSIGSGCCVKEIISSDNVRLFKTAGKLHIIAALCSFDYICLSAETMFRDVISMHRID